MPRPNRKFILKGQIVRATNLSEAGKKKYFGELGKYDIPTLKKILKFKRLIK